MTYAQPSYDQRQHRWPSNEDVNRPASADRCLDCRVHRFSEDPDTIELAQGACLGHPPRMAYYVDATMATPEGYVPAAVTEGVSGFRRMTGNGEHARPWFWGQDLNTAKEIAADANAKLGLSPKDVNDILTSSIAAQHRQDARRAEAEERWENLKKGRA